MTDISATVAVPADQVDAARYIGIPGAGTENENPQWAFVRALTDSPGGENITHYLSSGAADAALLALIVNLPGVLVVYPEGAQAALASWGLHFWVDPNEEI